MVSLWCGWGWNVAHGCLYPDLLVAEAIYVLWGMMRHRSVSAFPMLWFQGHDMCPTNLFVIISACISIYIYTCYFIYFVACYCVYMYILNIYTSSWQECAGSLVAHSFGSYHDSGATWFKPTCKTPPLSRALWSSWGNAFSCRSLKPYTLDLFLERSVASRS